MAPSQRLVLALGLTQTLAWASTYYIPATMIGAAAQSFGVSRTVLLGGFSVALLVCGLCSPWVGRFIDRFGGRGMLAGSAVVSAIGLALMAAAWAVWVWYAAWLVVGVGMAMGLYDATFATLGRLLGTQARSAIVGVTLMAGFANTIGWPTGLYLVEHVGWRWSVASYAVMQLVVILPISWFCVPRPGPAAPPVAARPDAPSPQTRVFVLMATYFTLRAAITAVLAVHVLVLLQGLGASVGQALLASAFIGPAQVAARLFDWKFGRGFNPMVAALTGTVMLPISLGALLMGLPYGVFGLLYGMSNGILTITRGTLPLHVFGPAGYGGRLGRIALPSMVAAAVMPTALSPLIDIYPAWQVVGALTATGISALGLLLALRRPS